MAKKHSLQTLFENMDLDEVRSYSGRAMYGEKCLAVVIEGSALGIFIGNVIEEMSVSNDLDVEDVSCAFHNMRTDSMGRSGMVIYFPDVPFVADDEETEGCVGCENCEG